MLDRNLDVWVGEVGGVVAGDAEVDAIEHEADEDDDDPYRPVVSGSVNDMFKPVPDNAGPCSFLMSPKYFSVSFNASSWLTPAKATTILSGRKKMSRYFSTVLLLINCKRS